MEIITGFHAIEEAVKSGKSRGTLYITGRNKRHVKLQALAEKYRIKTVVAGEAEIDRISGGADSRGAVYTAFPGREEQASGSKAVSVSDFIGSFNKESSLVLLLDSITDPHNFGAVIRSADQFCADLIIVPSRRSAGDMQTVRKTSAGAVAHAAIVQDNLSRSIDALKKAGFWVYAADMDGTDIRKADLKGNTALILGSEGSGVSKLLLDKCDGKIKIPAAGHVDSFNVSVAAGIIMYEVRRQQDFLMPA